MTERALHSVDLFAGCGGLSLGLSYARFKPLAFCEINKDAADTFEQNHGGDTVERIGPVEDMTDEWCEERRKIWEARFGGVDLVCGGPPCQGYSGIGHRRSYEVEREEVPSNHLFKQMVRVVRGIQPRMFLFENVRGLLSGRWKKGDEKGEIWRDVRKTFASIPGYDIGWQLVQAKDFGVPQNRPRILLVGVHKDLGLRLERGDPSNAASNPRGLLPEPTHKSGWPNLEDVLGDLDDARYNKEPFCTSHYLMDPEPGFQEVMRTRRDGSIMKKGDTLTEQEYTRHSDDVVEKFKHMLKNRGEILPKHQTKKFAQRVLPRKWDEKVGPTITATSLPDDFVHYHRPRILTVREWARLQTFPDWYQFAGKRTTGGTRRAGKPTEGIWEREVPKYTQIGNAVPVDLAGAIGKHLAKLLRQAD